MKRLFALLFVLPLACFAQSFDGFQGLVTYSNSTSTPLGNGNTLSIAGTVSQSGTTQTFTPSVSGASSGTCALGATAFTYSSVRFCSGEPMMISGTSTAMDYSFQSTDATARAGMSVITAMNSTTITLTAFASHTVGSTSGVLTDGHYYVGSVPYGTTTKFGYLSPLNHIFNHNSVGAATISTNGATKFGSTCAAYAGTMGELAAQLYNGPGMDSDGGYDPTTVGSCSSNTKYPYHYEVVGNDGYFMANLGSYNTQAGKDLNAGTNASYGCPLKRAQADYFDSRFSTFELGYLNGGSTGSDFTSVNRWKSPYNVSIMLNDTGVYSMMFNSGDVFPTLPRGHTDCNAGMLTVATSPIQAFNNTNPYNSQAEVYADPLLYTKALSNSAPGTCSNTSPCSWPDFVRFLYSTIGAVNTAWGSTYTTLGSSGLCVGYAYGWCGSTASAEAYGTGDGTTVTFTHTLANHSSVSAHSIQICRSDASPSCVGGDRGTTGTLGGTGISSGSCTLSTGVCTITFSSAPANGATITAHYIQNGFGLGTGLMDEDGHHSWWGASGAGAYTCTSVIPAHQINHAYNVNDIVLDASSVSQQIATVAGTSAGSSPSFSATAGTPTTDGGVTWDSVGAPLCGTGGDYSASTVNAQAAIDVNTWLGEFASQFYKVTNSAILTLFPGTINKGTDETGVAYSPARKPILQAAQQYIPIVFVQLLGTFSDPNALDKLRYTTANFTGPFDNYQNFGSQQSPNPCPTLGPSCTDTQQHRGQAWYSVQTLCTTTLTFSGTIQCTGEEWWATGDPFQGLPWGEQTEPLGNFYDGVEDVVASVACSPPNAAKTCGGEASASWNGSNAIYGAGLIQAGNALWTVAPTTAPVLNTPPGIPAKGMLVELELPSLTH